MFIAFSKTKDIWSEGKSIELSHVTMGINK